MSKFRNLSDGTKKKLIIGSGIFLILVLLVIFYIKKQYDNYNYIKVHKNNYLVYTAKSTKKDVYTKNIPYLNVNTEQAKLINEDINSFLSDYLKNDMCAISYDYDISGKVLSLMIKVVDYDTDYAPLVYFRSYNYNLETSELMDDVGVLSLFNVDENTVESIIESKLNEYYEELLDEEYFDEAECNFDCFLKNREIDGYLDDVSYYIKSGSLIAYKPYVFYSYYGEEDFFKEEHLKFVIVENKES